MDKTKPTREDILATINKIIEEDYDDTYYPYEPLTEDNLLLDSNMDSFSYTMFWLNVQEPYNLRVKRKYKSIEEYPDEQYSKDMISWINKLDYKTYKVKHLINRIEKCM